MVAAGRAATLKPQKNQKGYVALMAVLIIGAAATAIGLTLLTNGTDANRLALAVQQGKQARVLAVACAEEAMQQLHDNIDFTATNSSLSLGQGSCTYTVGVAGPTNRIVSATGTVSDTTRKIQATVTVGSTALSATTWLDVSDRFAAINYVQGATNTIDTGTTNIAQAFSNNVTAGNLIAVAVSWDTVSSTSFTGCTDTRSNSYTTVGPWNDTTGTQALAICYAVANATGSDTVTATFGASSATRRIIVNEYSGVATSSPVDISGGIQAQTATTTTDAVTSGSVTTTQNGDLIFGAVMDTSSAGASAPGTGFTGRGYANSKDLVVEDRQQQAAGSVAATFTFGTTHRYNAAVVAFKAARQ